MAKLASDGCFYTKHEHYEYHGTDAAWCWDLAKRVKVTEENGWYWALAVWERKALHAFLLRVLRVKNVFRKAWRVLNHPCFIEKLGETLQGYIARFLTGDIVMLKAMTRRQRSVYTHSDPVFQIEWYFWKLPRETDATLDDSIPWMFLFEDEDDATLDDWEAMMEAQTKSMSV